ncbi:MAG TPA: lipoyl(octanoyl) transferase LipB [Candidatus Limnocylindrales bacterium]|nr:lipoyl(octanoyl) transferase LipB [Candidatus Limnocylindrales bacterium]
MRCTFRASVTVKHPAAHTQAYVARRTTRRWYRRGVADVKAELQARWLGRIDYRAAWELQHELVARRRANEIPDQLLLLEHPAVLTLGRQSDRNHVLASADELARRGIDVIRVERGGEVTYHGPGQLVAYPIVRLADRGVLLRPFVRLLEQSMIDTAAGYGVEAGRRSGYPGVWCDAESATPRKLGALGLRIEGGVSYHGIALNVNTDLDDFELIDACGLPDTTTTSLALEAGWAAHESRPSTASVANVADRFEHAFRMRLEEATAAVSRAAQSEPVAV